MADFGFDWGVDDDENNNSNNISSDAATEELEAAAAVPDSPTIADAESVHITASTMSLPPGVVVHRVAASDKQANPHGTTESELLEPMVEDKAKQLQATALEHEEANLSPLEVFCQRSSSVFIFQRVWAAKEVGRLLQCEARDVAVGVLVPIAMRLAEDRELFVRETMAQNLLDVLCFYYENKSGDDRQAETMAAEEIDDSKEKPRLIVPPACEPSAAAFGAWLHGVLLSPHPSVSLAAQRAAVALGRRLSFDRFHTEIVHGVVLGLVQNAVHQHLERQRQRSKDMVVKPRASSGDDSQQAASAGQPAPRAALLTSGLATLFGRRGWQQQQQQQPGDDAEGASEQGGLDLDALMGDGGAASPGFFVSPADEQARVEATRRKLLMLHMIHLVAAEYGPGMRPAVFVPVVERAAKDRAFEVRRDAAAVLGSLAKAVSPDLALDVLFPAFAALAQDAVWQVRQSAARHALPGLALVLAARSGPITNNNSDSLPRLPRVAKCERKLSLQRLARHAGSSSSSSQDGPAEPSESMELDYDEDDDEEDPLAAFSYENHPPRAVADKQWQQLVARLAGPREPSHQVRAALFESVGRLALALADCPRTRDVLVALVVSDVQRAHSEPTAGRLGLFGSAASLQDRGEDHDGEDDDDDDDDEDDDNDEDGDNDESNDDNNSRSDARSGSSSSDAPSAESAAGSSRSNGGGGPAGARRVRPPATRLRAVSRDILYQCAYNFPALLAAVGSSSGSGSAWERLRDVYMQLGKTEHADARQTLACSLHEVARMVQGQAAAAADLESVLCLFLIDAPLIKMGAIRRLGDTLTWLPAPSRARCLPMIMQVFKHDGSQWRTRELMATQLVHLCHLFAPAVVVGSLLPQAVEWAHDPVAGVRAAVAPAFPVVFELTKLDPLAQVRFFETVISFSHAASFRGRLFFVEICAALLAHDQDPDADPVDFDQFFLPSLAALASDRVVNVRIALARLVRRMLENRMRRQSISTAWMSAAATIDDPIRHRSLTRGNSISPSSSSNTISNTGADTTATDSPRHSGPNSRFYAHRSLGSVARRPRRNTTPMRAHLLAVMVQQLAQDPDRDVLDLVRDLPGQTAVAPTPIVADRASAPPDPTRSSRLKEFPKPPPSPPLETTTQCMDEVEDTSLPDSISAISLPPPSSSSSI
ncbi:hypothetical protein GGI09_000646 [Coemansia sp. S100]|nr:hypothetical protein GGI09_000646 [Coemansia sp. S100]KAJ2110317.1 hypothetical protein GGI16_000347 [Coemansia sp. S142-1]